MTELFITKTLVSITTTKDKFQDLVKVQKLNPKKWKQQKVLKKWYGIRKLVDKVSELQRARAPPSASRTPVRA